MNHPLLVRAKEYAEKHSFVFPLVLLLVTLICYAPMGLFAGFHWDDWPPVLLSNIAKRPDIFWISFDDRPYSAWTFSVMFPLLGNSAAAWQLATMIIRWAGVYLFYLVLVNLFPRERGLFRWAALISIVLPVFQYQYISVAFSQHFLTYAIFAASLYLLVLSIRYPRWFWLFYPLSLLGALAHVFMMEYFVGLEILRPFVLYLALKRFAPESKHKVRKFLLTYLPYIGILILYLYWRFIVYPNGKFNTDAAFSNKPYFFYHLLSAPLSTLKDLATTIIADLRFTFVSSWVDRLWPSDLYLESKMLWAGILIGLVVVGLFWIFFGVKKGEGDSVELTNQEFWKDIVLGIVVFLFGIAPVWITLRQVSVGKYSERFVLAAIPGIALIIVALFWKIIGSPRVRMILLSVLVVLSVGYQVQMGNDMVKDYNTQQDIAAQLKWRAPQLQAGTAIYSPVIFSGYEADYSYSMSINLLYDGKAVEPDLNYWFFTPRDYQVADLLYDPTLAVKSGIKGTTYSGTAGNMVAVYKNGSGCLLILDPIYSQLSTTVGDFAKYGSLTNFSRISDNGSEETVFPQALGKISTGDWCYYFERADLAKQEKQWDKVVTLYDQANQKGYKPYKAVEYVPLITAQAELGQVKQALATTQKAMAMSSTVNPVTCALWNSLMQEHPEINESQVTAAVGTDTCTFQTKP